MSRAAKLRTPAAMAHAQSTQSEPVFRATADAVVPTTSSTSIDGGTLAQASAPDAIPPRTRKPVRVPGGAAIRRSVASTSPPVGRQELGTNGAPILE